MMSGHEIAKLKERVRIPVLIAIGVVSIWYFMSDGLEVSLDSAMQSFQTNLNAASNSVRQRDSNQQARELLEQLRVQLGEIDSVMPTESYLPALIDKIQELARDTAVQIRQVNYAYGPYGGRRHDNDEYTPSGIVLSLQMQAEYRAIRAFLQAVECLPTPLVPVEVVANKGGMYTIQILQMVKP